MDPLHPAPPEVRPHVVFLSDYDMQLTEQLVQGADV
jgi:starch phosphorylase